MKKIILLLLLLVLVCGCSSPKEETVEKPVEEETVEEVKELPFVEAQQIKISDASGTYEYPVYPFITDTDNEIIEVKEIETQATPESLHFHDLRIEESEDGLVYSFISDGEVDMITKAQPTDYYWYYSFSATSPAVFDYYTGDIFNENRVSVDGLTTFLDPQPADSIAEDEYAYSEVTWDGKSHKVGIYEEFYYSSNPEDIYEEDGWDIYKDTITSQTRFFIKTDKEYDGLMIAVLKSGTNKEKNQKINAYYDRYEQLLKEAEETGEKSEELLKYEEKLNRVQNVLESSYDDDLHYTKDDFYFIRVSEIPKAEDQQ